MTSVYGGTEDRADTGPGNTSNTALPGEGGVIDQKFETGRSNAAPEHLRRVEGTDTNATPSDRCGHQAHEGAESAMIENGDPPFTMPSSEADSNESKSETAERLFEIRPSKLGGLGAFALRELWKGDIILVEEPLLKTTHFGLRRAFDKLSEPEKQIYMNLHCGENCSPFKKIEEIKQRNSYVSAGCTSRFLGPLTRINYNSFLMKGGLVAIFATASRFNHACRPVRNVKYELDGETGVITLTVCQDVVPAGTELTVNYGGSPAQLYQDFGFICKCGGCDSLTADDIRRMRDEAIGIYR